MMNSVNAERAVSVRSVLAIPALLLIIMSVHSFLAKAQDKPAGTEAKAKAELTTDPSPAQKGSNTIRVKLTDPAGKPIVGAQVTATFFMAAMPAMNMPEMKTVIKGADKGDGIYEGKGDLGSAGMWEVTVTAQQNGTTIVTKKLTVKAAGGM
jgi:Cu(I)/Ag(I) efflux system membrane fusion protein/cobalt-zinc-cadmium efflux system membrane fusion protein